MEDRHFIWDEFHEGLVLSGPSRAENEKKKVKRKKSLIPETTIYCPHKRLIFHFKDSLSYSEQSHFRKHYRRRSDTVPVVVLLQDVKDLAMYLLTSPISLEFINFIHQPIVDRFLRALILYLQNYIITWQELGEKRAATAKRAANPLAGGARVQRAQEMKVLRCVLAREYADLIIGADAKVKKFHHVNAGQISYVQSQGEKDIRVFEGLVQFAHIVAWIALERKQRELIEIEIQRLFKTEAFNTAKRRCQEKGKDWEVPEDELWILYGPKMPSRMKILRNSPLIYEIVYTDCDHRVLSLGLTNAKSEDPRVTYLENALLAREEDLPLLGIKLGILGLPRTDFDLLLTPNVSEDDQVIAGDDDHVSDDDNEVADDYERLMPAYGVDTELKQSYLMERVNPRYTGDDELRRKCRRKWMIRELRRAASNNTKINSLSID